jgi:hypothetical protein
MMNHYATVLFAVVFATGAQAQVTPNTGSLTGLDESHWVVYAQHEEKALTDYWWRMTGPDVIDNGRQLRELARSPTFGQAHPSCGEAALTLSHMVTGQYMSARRLAVSGDWFAMTASYLEQRRACIGALNVDIANYPLPGWFGR